MLNSTYDVVDFDSPRIDIYKNHKISWAIHTTLYRVCCIEYTWLFVNAQFYAVLCISHSKCNFLAFKQFDSSKPTLLLKNIWKHAHIFAFTQFGTTKPVLLLKYGVYLIFTRKLSTTSIRYCIIFQQYTQYNDTTASSQSNHL